VKSVAVTPATTPEPTQPQKFMVSEPGYRRTVRKACS
jgi:hypothetical protein